MSEEKKRPYCLLHVTSQKNLNKIREDKKIKPSVHNVEKGKIQWLGDGVYFWDVNDEEAIDVGRNLVKGKYKTSKIAEIVVDIDILPKKHVNLVDKKWYRLYIEFLKKTNPDYCDLIKDYIKMARTEDKVSTKNLNKIGKLVGTTINLFLHCMNDEGLEIDMVSGYFFHGKNKFSFFNQRDRIYRQFCVKNVSLINQSCDDWKIIE